MRPVRCLWGYADTVAGDLGPAQGGRVARVLAGISLISRYADDSGKAGRLRPTAAVAAGVVDTLWDFPRLSDAAMACCP